VGVNSDNGVTTDNMMCIIVLQY